MASSEAKEEPVAIGAKSPSPGCRAGSFTGPFVVGADETGGTSRVGVPEQFGPSHGFTGVGAGCGSGVDSAVVGVAEVAGAFRMTTWSPHPADARPGLKHATTATSAAARQARVRGGVRQAIGVCWG
jgi:hypothetical protein